MSLAPACRKLSGKLAAPPFCACPTKNGKLICKLYATRGRGGNSG